MERQIGTLVAQVARLMRRAFDTRAREIGVTRPQWQVLSVLKRHEGIRPGGLAELLEVEAITAGRMIERMADAGLVERERDPNDGRAWRISLTERGHRIVDSLEPLAIETTGDALAGIAEEDKADLLRSLQAMRANLTGKAASAPADVEG